jgi:hypothetical protein
MPLDLGTAIANIGTTWNSALQQKKQRETLEKQQFIENMLRQDQLGLQRQAQTRADDTAVFDQQMEMAQNFGGRQMPLEEAQRIFSHPKLQGLVVNPLEARLPSTSLQGVGMGMPQGQSAMGSQMAAPSIAVSGAQSSGIEPGMAEIETPQTSGMRIANMQTQAANTRAMQNAELRTSLAEYAAQQARERDADRFAHQSELANARMQTQIALAGQRGARGTTKLVEDVDENGKPVRRLIDSDTGDIIKTYDKPPTQVKNNMAGSIAEIEAMQESIKRAQELGARTKWRGVGPAKAWLAEKGGKIPLIGTQFTNVDDETLRQEIAKVMAHGKHELYGAALTGGERFDADRFLRNVESNPTQIAISLDNLYRFNDKKLQHLRPAGGVGNPVAGANTDQAGANRVRAKWVNGVLVDASGKPIE